MPAAKSRHGAVQVHDGRTVGGLHVPDKADPAFQTESKASLQRLNSLIEHAASETGLTREQFVDELTKE